MEALYWIVLGAIAFLVAGNLFDSEQSTNWKVRALLSVLWFSLAAIATQFKSREILIILGTIFGTINALASYALWSGKLGVKK